MKNKYFEHLRKAAKQYHRHDRTHYGRGGLYVPHVYDELLPARWTGSNEVGLIVNDYHVHVSWMHPRMRYQHLITKEAMQLVAAIPYDPFAHATPHYRQVGRSRKSIASWTTPYDRDNAWLIACAREESRLMREADFCIKPYWQSKWTRYARSIEICIPIDIRNEEDLRTLAGLAKRFLKRETTLDREFPGYPD
jgi:hypothetical protein